MGERRLSRGAKKFPWAPVRPHNKLQSDREEDNSWYKQLTLDGFIGWIHTLRDKYIYRFPKIKVSRFEKYT